MISRQRVAVIGLGLMGGSLARDLATLGAEVYAYDRDPATLSAARADGVIQAELPSSWEGVESMDVVVLATPVTTALAILEAIAPRLDPGCIVTDLGSTKQSIALGAARAGLAERFVGSHPLTGDHRSGWAASRSHLFQAAPVYLCPTDTTRADVLDTVRELWQSLGALPEVISPAEHDRLLAWTSHLPQVASAALARSLAAAGHPRSRLGPGGRDATRLAGSSPEMWSAICSDNADAVSESVRALIEELSTFCRLVQSREPEALLRFFADARAWTQSGPNTD